MTQHPEASPWAVVLAAGDGRRIQAHARGPDGTPVPKQFCGFGRRDSMLRWALSRARGVAPPERIVTIVARDHARWWKTDLHDVLPENVVVQPRNRGTAAGVLLPLVRVLARDPEAVVVVLPSDHYVADEGALARALNRGVEVVRRHPSRVVLLGITPEEPDSDYGWILPGKPLGTHVRSVVDFVEKPIRAVASELHSGGALWNSFMFVANARTLLHLYSYLLPDLLEPFLRELVVSPRLTLEGLYDEAPTCDFSRDLLQRAADRLSVLAVPPCGWTDLGTPSRLARHLGGARRDLEPAAG